MRVLFMIFILLAGCGGGGGGGTGAPAAVNVSWEAPVSAGDGTPLADLAGFRVYYGTSPGLYSEMVDVGNATSYRANLAPGTYYFAVTAYDTSGDETDFSEEVIKTG